MPFFYLEEIMFASREDSIKMVLKQGFIMNQNHFGSTFELNAGRVVMYDGPLAYGKMVGFNGKPGAAPSKLVFPRANLIGHEGTTELQILPYDEIILKLTLAGWVTVSKSNSAPVEEA
jgi:hypothetical protein